MGYHWAMIFNYIIITHIEQIFQSTIYITKKKFASQNFGNQIWFCTRLIRCDTIISISIGILHLDHVQQEWRYFILFGTMTSPYRQVSLKGKVHILYPGYLIA